MTQATKLGLALDAIASDLGVLTLATQRGATPEVFEAVDRVQEALLAVVRRVPRPSDEEDLDLLEDVWQAIAFAQEQVRAAQAAVEAARQARARGLAI